VFPLNSFIDGFAIIVFILCILWLLQKLIKYSIGKSNKGKKSGQGETKMVDILKEKMNESMDELNQQWVNQIKKAETVGLDMSEMFGKYSQIMKGVDKEFNEFKNRKQNKKW